MGSSFILILVYKLELAEAEKESSIQVPTRSDSPVSKIIWMWTSNVLNRWIQSFDLIFQYFLETRVWAWKDQQNLVISF